MLIIDHGRVIYDGTVDGLKDAYATGRGLVVDLRTTDAPMITGATLLRSEGRRHWLEVPRDQRVPDVVARLLSDHDVEDLRLEEPDIEDIIRRIYREGAVPGTTA